MRERLEQIATSAVDLSERDERAAEIVSAARAELEGGEVQEERALGVRARALGEVASGDNEIVASGLAAVGAFPTGGVPLVEATVRPSRSTSRTAPALNSSVNLRRMRRCFASAMDTVYSFRGVSTKSGQDHFDRQAAESVDGRAMRSSEGSRTLIVVGHRALALTLRRQQ